MIQTYMGTLFECAIIKELCNIFNIKKRVTKPYVHEEIGKVERLKRTLQVKLRIKCKNNFEPWGDQSANIIFSIRITSSRSTNLSPLEILYGTTYMFTCSTERKKTPEKIVKNLSNYRKAYMSKMKKNHDKIMQKSKSHHH
ncbi:hypothetical protein A3Q56_04683 [Intoshia linei]|uniref:Integrase catalytic domain-containing protein n=1 Tax=Intoshia linei TaxID=1819745 RepID=A0A177B1T8_9BILA|nr:hypothetical protein A3Q56_04683 [Intoshia linei]